MGVGLAAVEIAGLPNRGGRPKNWLGAREPSASAPGMCRFLAPSNGSGRAGFPAGGGGYLPSRMGLKVPRAWLRVESMGK